MELPLSLIISSSIEVRCLRRAARCFHFSRLINARDTAQKEAAAMPERYGDDIRAVAAVAALKSGFGFYFLLLEL
jgi:hypothetical protein